MKLSKIYERAIKKGMEVDPRGKKGVSEALKKVKEKYEKLRDDEKEFFDEERFSNPYPDTRILYGDGNTDARNIMVGIDIQVGEILLADRLKQRGKQIDLVISHHPEGRALANLYQVMDMHADVLLRCGVPINIGEAILDERIKEVHRRLLPLNHQRTIDAARSLEIPFMCIHTPADNCVTHFLQDLFDKEKPYMVSDVLRLLRNTPEYNKASRMDYSPKVVVGSRDKRAGKVFVDMTGGTGGSKKAIAELSKAGVGTIVGMHIGEDHRKEAEKNHINIVIAGHMSSDSMGMNIILGHIFEKEKINIIPQAGYIRVER